MARLPPLNWLRAFEASARALSFTEAAQELHMTQSAVSQQIKSLESALGRQLFHRRARGLELTDIGRGYLPTVQAAFNTLEEGTAVLTGRNEPGRAGTALQHLVRDLLADAAAAATSWTQYPVGASRRRHLDLADREAAQPGGGRDRAGPGQVGGPGRPAPDARHDLSGLHARGGRAHPRRVRTCCKENLFELPGTLQTWDNWLGGHIGNRKYPTPRIHRASTWVLSMNWALQGLGVALAHDTVANDLIAVRPAGAPARLFAADEGGLLPDLARRQPDQPGGQGLQDLADAGDQGRVGLHRGRADPLVAGRCACA